MYSLSDSCRECKPRPVVEFMHDTVHGCVYSMQDVSIENLLSCAGILVGGNNNNNVT